MSGFVALKWPLASDWVYLRAGWLLRTPIGSMCVVWHIFGVRKAASCVLANALRVVFHQVQLFAGRLLSLQKSIL
jgi:hypothetical protein